MQRTRKHIRSAFTPGSQDKLLSIYCVAGYPEKESLTDILPALDTAGVDFIEVGIPFSDPLADGPVIQECSTRALANGMTLSLLFAQLEHIDAKCPILLMGYLNPILQYGFERFCADCEKTGVSGVIIPDLPPALLKNKFNTTFATHDLSAICMITPETQPDRIRMLDALSDPFIYAVSSSSTTGNQKSINSGITYLEHVNALQLAHPLITGFNIRDKESFTHATLHTAGGIIGTAFLNHLKEHGVSHQSIHDFTKTIRP